MWFKSQLDELMCSTQYTWYLFDHATWVTHWFWPDKVPQHATVGAWQISPSWAQESNDKNKRSHLPQRREESQVKPVISVKVIRPFTVISTVQTLWPGRSYLFTLCKLHGLLQKVCKTVGGEETSQSFTSEDLFLPPSFTNSSNICQHLRLFGNFS